VLGRSLDDLPPQTRRLLHFLEAHVAKQCSEKQLQRPEARFTRREVREASRWGDTQLKLHLARLVELELLAAHRAVRGGFEYELLYDGRGKDGAPFLTGLVDVEALGAPQARHAYDGEQSGAEGSRSGAGRPLVGPQSGGGRPGENGEKLSAVAAFSPSAANSARNARPGSNGAAASYVVVTEGAA